MLLLDVWYNGNYAMTFYHANAKLTNPITDSNKIAHSWEDWGLVPTARPFFVPPTPKTSELEVRAANSKIDTSELLSGYPLFNNRQGSWTFYITSYDDTSHFLLDNNDDPILDNNGDPIRTSIPQSFTTRYHQILSAIQGREVFIVLDEDPNYYYKCRVHVSEWVSANDNSCNGLTITYDAFPFKMEKVEESITIYNEHLDVNRIEEKIYIEGGEMPFILAFASSMTPRYGMYVISFKNPELDINISRAFYGNGSGKRSLIAGVYTPTVTSGSYAGSGTIDDSIAYKDYVSKTCLVTNISGSNTCEITVEFKYFGNYFDDPPVPSYIYMRKGFL